MLPSPHSQVRLPSRSLEKWKALRISAHNGGTCHEPEHHSPYLSWVRPNALAPFIKLSSNHFSSYTRKHMFLSKLLFSPPLRSRSAFHVLLSTTKPVPGPSPALVHRVACIYNRSLAHSGEISPETAMESGVGEEQWGSLRLHMTPRSYSHLDWFAPCNFYEVLIRSELDISELPGL